MARIYLSPPDVGSEEREALLSAFDSGWLAPLGPDVEAFERELAAVVSVEHAVALSSGTAGLHLALLLAGVRPQDRVIVPTLTFAATANAVNYIGARPVFLDVDEATWTLDPELLEATLREAASENRPIAAVITVDLYGQCADYDRLLPACRLRGVPVIQDSAEALGAEYAGRPAGGQCAMGVFSFNGNKIITTSGGGMLVTNDAGWAERARYLASQARDRVRHYQHSSVGYNYRMSNLLAGMGRAQLQQLSAKVEARRAVFHRYLRTLGELTGFSFMPEAQYGRSTRWLTCMLVDAESGTNPEAICEALEQADIEARPVWKPMHMQPVFADCEVLGGAVAEGLFQRGVCLPSGSGLTSSEQDRIIEIVSQTNVAGRLG